MSIGNEVVPSFSSSRRSSFIVGLGETRDIPAAGLEEPIEDERAAGLGEIPSFSSSGRSSSFIISLTVGLRETGDIPGAGLGGLIEDERAAGLGGIGDATATGLGGKGDERVVGPGEIGDVTVAGLGMESLKTESTPDERRLSRILPPMDNERFMFNGKVCSKSVSLFILLVYTCKMSLGESFQESSIYIMYSLC